MGSSSLCLGEKRATSAEADGRASCVGRSRVGVRGGTMSAEMPRSRIGGADGDRRGYDCADEVAERRDVGSSSALCAATRAARPGTLGPQSELRCAGEHPPLEVARRRGGRPSLVRPWCERISTPACLYGPSEREKDHVRGGEVVFRTTHVLTRFLRAGVIYCTHWLVGTWSPHGTTTHGFSYAPLYCAHFAHLFGQPGSSLDVHHALYARWKTSS